MSSWLSYLLLPFRLTKTSLKWLFYINILLLPITSTSILSGFIDGCLFTVQSAHLYTQTQEDYRSNVRSVAYLEYFAVPGAPSALENGIPPFNVVEIRSPHIWWTRAGLARLSKYAGTPKEHTEDKPELASLDNLYRTRKEHEIGKPFHHFIYLSDSVLVGDESHWFDHWDKGFNDLLKHHYIEPAVANASFSWINCRRSFLCDTWRAKGPAFLHLTTETPSVHIRDRDLEQTLAARPRSVKNAPLMARLIEFPTSSPYVDSLQLVPPGRFPSPYEQMLVLTSSADNWEFFPVYSRLGQILNWFSDYCRKLEKRWPSLYGRLSDAETYMRNRFEPDGVPWLMGTHLLSFAATAGPLAVLFPVTEIALHQLSLFMGTSVEDRLKREKYESAAVMSRREEDGEENFMAAMLAGFIRNQGPEYQKVLEGSDEARKLVADMWKAVRKPAEEAAVEGADVMDTHREGEERMRAAHAKAD